MALRLLSSSPNVHRRRARLRGVVRGVVTALGPVAMSGKSVDDGLKEFDVMEAEMVAAFADLRAAYQQRRVVPINPPKEFKPEPVREN